MTEPKQPASPRLRILAALEAMPDEAFSWFVVACKPSAMLDGAKIQIWPDGIGGFSAASKQSIEEVRAAAVEYFK